MNAMKAVLDIENVQKSYLPGKIDNIRVLFLLESGLLGAVSGLIGITIGAGLSFLISNYSDRWSLSGK